jgi:hypothetical protein
LPDAGKIYIGKLVFFAALPTLYLSIPLPTLSPPALVIDRKRIFLFWPKTNIRQENAAEYSADNEYSAQGSKHRKNVNLNENHFFFRDVSCKLQSINCQDLWATKTFSA